MLWLIRIYCLILAYHLPTFTFAQKQADNWMFGANQLNFATGPPSMTYHQSLFLPGGSASMSDSNGELLFFSDGYNVYDKLRQKMPGVGPTGLDFGIRTSQTTQSVIALPTPGNDSLYYLFYLNVEPVFNSDPHLYYAVINMRSRGGLGDVVQKDIPLFSNLIFSEKLIATLHCNKRDIWLIGHLKNSDKYLSILITASGISASPVQSSCTVINNGNSVFGCMKVSPIGDKLAAVHRNNGLDLIEYCDFNNQTGVVSNPRLLSIKPAYALPNPSYTIGAFGVEFSPSGKYLYASGSYVVQWPCCSYPTGHIYQFDASLGSEAAIQGSRVFIDSVAAALYCALQVANDGKIYANNAGSITTIHQPEQQGTLCSLQRFSHPGSVSAGDLPVFVQSYFRYPIIATGSCQFRNINFSVLGAIGVDSVKWDFGDPMSGINNTSALMAPAHIYSGDGMFKVRLVLFNSGACSSDTVYKIVYAGPFAVFLGNDTAICRKDLHILSVPISGARFLWSTGSNDSSISVSQPGKYWVRVALGDCTVSDTIDIAVKELPSFTLGADTAICTNQHIALTPAPNHPNSLYLWSTGASTNSITISAPDKYWLELRNADGCKYRDTIQVSQKPVSGFTLGNDTTLCNGQSLLLSINLSGAGYMWSTGSIENHIQVTQPGTYWIDVTQNNCTSRDSIRVLAAPSPAVWLGNDTSICNDNTLLLNAFNAGASYSWQDNAVTSSYLVSKAGRYSVEVRLGSCVASDTVEISYKSKPIFTLGADQYLCPGGSLTLSPKINALSYRWQDGSTSQNYAVKNAGLYYVQVTNECGTGTDSVMIAQGSCHLIVPNAFSPNNDRINDNFIVAGTERVTNFHLVIFNRWGQLIFETRDKLNAWNGKFRGTDLPVGAYYYVLQYRMANENKPFLLKGSILLIR